MLKCSFAGKTNGSYFAHPICMVTVLQSTQRPWTNWQRSVRPSGRGEKLHFPSVIPAPWNAGIVLVTAGFQSTLKCNWTLERQTEKGRHCQGQSLAWHAIATSGLIDLYKANPPLPFCLIDLGYSLSQTVRQKRMQQCFFYIIQWLPQLPEKQSLLSKINQVKGLHSELVIYRFKIFTAALKWSE